MTSAAWEPKGGASPWRKRSVGSSAPGLTGVDGESRKSWSARPEQPGSDIRAIHSVHANQLVLRGLAASQFQLSAPAFETLGQKLDQRLVGGPVHRRRGHPDLQLGAVEAGDGRGTRPWLHLDGEGCTQRRRRTGRAGEPLRPVNAAADSGRAWARSQTPARPACPARNAGARESHIRAD